MISEKRNPDQMLCVFVSFFDRCMNLTQAAMQLQGSYKTVNNDHDTTDTPKKLKTFEENGRKEVK